MDSKWLTTGVKTLFAVFTIKLLNVFGLSTSYCNNIHNLTTSRNSLKVFFMNKLLVFDVSFIKSGQMNPKKPFIHTQPICLFFYLAGDGSITIRHDS